MQHRMTETKLSDGRRALPTLSYNWFGNKGIENNPSLGRERLTSKTSRKRSSPCP